MFKRRNRIASKTLTQSFGTLLLGSVLLLTVMGHWVSAQTEAGAVDKLVTEIRAEAKRIDAANDAPQSPSHRRLELEASPWETSGLFEGSSPIYLYGRYSEGELVREETYYLRGGRLILAKVAQWYDVEDPRNAPAPPVEQRFYIQDDRTIRRVVAIGSGRPVSWKGDMTGEAALLQERSNKLSRILLSGIHDAGAMDSLAEFPLAGAPPK